MIPLQCQCDRYRSSVCILLMNVDLNKCEDIPVNEQCIYFLLMHAYGILSAAIQVFSQETRKSVAS